MTCPAPSTFNAAYLGKPGAMQLLPPPSQGISAPLTRAAVIHQLAGGGSTITRRRNTRRTYTLSWNNRDLDSSDILLAFYLGAMGVGPYAYMDPGFRNLQDFDVSTMGIVVSGVPGWSQLGGAIAFSTAVAPPFIDTGVLAWTSPTNTGVVVEGTYVSTTYTPLNSGRPWGVPYLVDQPFTTSLWARTASATCSARALAVGASGATTTPVFATGATVSLTTSWQRLQVAVPVGTGGWSAAATAYIGAGIQCMQAGAPTIYIASSQVEAGVIVASNQVTGVGVPRVSIADPSAISFQLWHRRTHSLILVEN